MLYPRLGLRRHRYAMQLTPCGIGSFRNEFQYALDDSGMPAQRHVADAAKRDISGAGKDAGKLRRDDIVVMGVDGNDQAAVFAVLFWVYYPMRTQGAMCPVREPKPEQVVEEAAHSVVAAIAATDGRWVIAAVPPEEICVYEVPLMVEGGPVKDAPVK